MSDLGSAATTFTGSVTNFKSQVGTVKNSITGITSIISDIVPTIEMAFDYVDPALQGVTIGVSVYFGVVIGFTILAITGCLLMTFCDKFKCRYLIYFGCCILFFLAIFGFLLSFLFSILKNLYRSEKMF